MQIAADQLVRSEGSVWIFEGSDDEGHRFRFGADWRPARQIALAIDEEGHALCDVPSYMLIPGPTGGEE